MTTENTAPEQDNMQTEAQETVEEQVNELAPEDKALEEAAQWKDKALRLAADMENLRKRTMKEVQDAKDYAVTSFARDLLDVKDNMERAMQSLESINAGEEMKPVVDGIKMVSDQLANVFTKAKIERIDAVGQKLNPELHQAMMQVPTNEHEAGTVVQEMQAGYTINGRLLRPSLVGTAKAAE